MGSWIMADGSWRMDHATFFVILSVSEESKQYPILYQTT